MKKKLLSIVLVLVLTMSIFTSMPLSANAVSYITNPSSVSGSSYTSSSTMASMLNKIFNGDIDMYTNSGCTSEVGFALGKSLNNSTTYYVKSKTTGNVISGKQCYIYANAVYNKLFNEWVGGNASSFAHSKKVIGGGASSASYSQFSNAGVRCGAYIRTTNNSSGAYSGNYGHSMIVLSYNSSGITYLEGNGDGNGLVRITTRTWSEFNSSQLSGKSRYICYVVQPTDSYYNSLYFSSHTHSYGSWSTTTVATCTGAGVQTRKCSVCGAKETKSISALGHSFGSWSTTTSATCTNTGVQTRTCSRCSTKETKSISALGHAVVNDSAVAATCTTSGKTAGTHCSRCNKVLTAQTTVSALGHNYGEWFVVTPSKPGVEGLEKRVCSRCSAYVTRAIPALEVTITIKTPSRTTIRCKDGIVLHTNIDGNTPTGATIQWTSNNSNFKVSGSSDGRELTIISNNNGYTTFTATLVDINGNVLATDSVEMYSKAGFIDKLGGFFRSLFGATTIYES